jgi:hypothetical protein
MKVEISFNLLISKVLSVLVWLHSVSLTADNSNAFMLILEHVEVLSV